MNGSDYPSELVRRRTSNRALHLFTAIKTSNELQIKTTINAMAKYDQVFLYVSTGYTSNS
jgi:hypothetical protein